MTGFSVVKRTTRAALGKVSYFLFGGLKLIR